MAATAMSSRFSSKASATGSQISAARALLGWTQQELAQAAGVHENTVAYWERAQYVTFGLSAPVTVRRLHQELLAAGVEITAEPERGVRFVPVRGQRKPAA